MKKRFIVLTDLSDHARHMLARVNEWAGKAGAELLLVHQVVRAMPGFADAEIVQSLKQAEKENALIELKLFAEDAAGDTSAMKFHADTVHLVSILEDLKAKDTADYIFVGLNDKPIIDRIFLGNTASELSKQLKDIIIAFPAAKNDIDMDTLHVGINEKYPLNEASFGSLMAVMQGLIQEVHFFSVIKPEENPEAAGRYLEALHDRYAGQVRTSHTLFRNDDPISAVKGFMMQNRNILVIQKGSRTLLDIFRRFWTTELINIAQIPIVILPNQD